MGDIEYEVRVLEVDHDEMVKKLEEMGATKVKDGMQRRYVYDFNPVLKHKYIRVRTDGVKSTLTIKHTHNDSIDGTEELEIEVSDFEKTNKILKELGYTPKGYQENHRTEYKLDDITFDIDRWPLIPEIMEIEGPGYEPIWDMVEKMGIPKEKVITGGAYEHYGIDSSVLGDLSFDMEEGEKNDK